MSRTRRKAKKNKGLLVRDGKIQPHLVSESCRNNGSCPYCRRNKTFKASKSREAAEQEMENTDGLLD